MKRFSNEGKGDVGCEDVALTGLPGITPYPACEKGGTMRPQIRSPEQSIETALNLGNTAEVRLFYLGLDMSLQTGTACLLDHLGREIDALLRGAQLYIPPRAASWGEGRCGIASGLPPHDS